MAPRQLLGAAGSLQALGYTPSRKWLVLWMEESHAQLESFNPVQLVQLAKVRVFLVQCHHARLLSFEVLLSFCVLLLLAFQILHGWNVVLGLPWVNALLAAVQRQLHCFNRTRLVEMLLALAHLGVKLDVGPRLVGKPVLQDPEGSTPAPVPNAASWLCAYLRCFLSRKFRQPLPRHQADLAVAAAAICTPSAVSEWDEEAAALLQQVLFPLLSVQEEGQAGHWLQSLPWDRVQAAQNALLALSLGPFEECVIKPME